MLPVLISQGLLERIDPAKVPGLAHLDPAFRTRKADPKDEWSVPYTWGTVGIAWRTDKVKGPIDSWAVFADAKATGENAYLLEEARDVIAAALLLHGQSVNSVEPAHLAQAKATLLGWRKSVKGFTGEVKDHLLSGEAYVIQAYNGDVAQAMAERKDIAFAVPKEGGILWVDNLVIPKGAPEKDLAHAFIEFVLDRRWPRGSARASATRCANKDAADKVPKQIREADAVIYAPEDVRKRLQQEVDLGGDLKKITDLWSEVPRGRLRSVSKNRHRPSLPAPIEAPRRRRRSSPTRDVRVRRASHEREAPGTASSTRLPREARYRRGSTSGRDARPPRVGSTVPGTEGKVRSR